MRINVLFREQNETFGGMRESDECIRFGFGEVQTVTENDYNGLVNRPSINSVELIGALTAEDLGLGRIYYDTTANWDAQPDLIGERGVIYIYSDHTILEDEVGNQTPLAGIRIGDGNAYLADLPFVSDDMTYRLVMHAADASIHVSPAEKEFWNNKVSAYLDHTQGEVLVLSKTSYEDENGDIHTVS